MEEKELYEINEEELDIENETFTYDQLQQIVSEVLPKINVAFESEAIGDQELFNEGCSDASYWCGYYSAMKSVGMSEDTILQMMLNRDTGNINFKQQEIINQGQIETARIQQIQTVQSQI